MKKFLTITSLMIFQSAYGATMGNNITFDNPLGSTKDLPALLAVVLKALVQLGVPVLTLFIVWAGFKFVTAKGDPGEIKKAREMLFWAVIGGAVLLGARLIASVIDTTVRGIAP